MPEPTLPRNAPPSGGVRNFLIKALGGNVEDADASSDYEVHGATPAIDEQALPPARPYEVPDTPGPTPRPTPPPAAAAPPRTAPPRPTAQPAAPRPVAPPPPPPTGGYQDDDGRTRLLVGADLDRIKGVGKLYSLEIRGRNSEWRHWDFLKAKPKLVGRSSEVSGTVPELASLATRHFLIALRDQSVIVDDLGASLNGVYRQVRPQEPVELHPGTRFRVGSHVIEFRPAEPLSPCTPAEQEGEVLWCSDLQPLGYLVFLRPDGSEGTAIPLTIERTILGRGNRPNKPVHLALPHDEVVSGQHAAVVTRGDGRFFLEDMGSTNGTFVQVIGSATLSPGEVIQVGRLQLRVVERTLL